MSLLLRELFPEPQRPSRVFLQQILAVTLMPMALMVEFILFSPFRPISRHLDEVAIALGMLSGPLWGFYVPRARDYAIARWTWVIPVALFALAFKSELRVTALARASAIFFNPPPGDEGLGLLITLPVASSVLYSIGAHCAYVRERRASANQSI